MTINGFGTEEWINENGDYHRADGPAVIWVDGKEWHQNGKYHRADGPAIIRQNGTQLWYRNGLRHREDGPAVTWANGSVEWWLNDRLYPFTEWCDQMGLNSAQRLMMRIKWNPE